MEANAGGVSSTWSGMAAGMEYVVNVGSGVGAVSITGKVDTGSAGSGAITGNGAAGGAKYVFGSFITSGICEVSGAGAAGTSVITGVFVVAGNDGVASIIWSETAAGVGCVISTGSGAGVGSEAGMG